VRGTAIAVAIVLAAASSIARADDKPWARGVSEENQAAALKLYREGNDDFVEDRFAAALAKYEAALKLWSHPAIHYNAAICFNSLDRPLEAYVHLEAALQYGAEPIGKDHLATGKQLRAALKPRVTVLEIVCSGPCTDRDAELLLDNEKLDLARSSAQLVLVGRHLIVASKPNYLTYRKSVEIGAGDKTTVKVELVLVPAAKRLARRWPTWKPWAVVGAGAGIALVGLAPLLIGNGQIDAGNAYFNTTCPSPCMATQPGESDYHRGAVWQGIGVGAFVAGGVVAASGFVMVLANQPRLVAPDVGRDHVAITLAGRW